MQLKILLLCASGISNSVYILGVVILSGNLLDIIPFQEGTPVASRKQSSCLLFCQEPFFAELEVQGTLCLPGGQNKG